MKDNQRIKYLMEVLKGYMHDTPAGENTYFYDEAVCDGWCLYDDILDTLIMMDVIEHEEE